MTDDDERKVKDLIEQGQVPLDPQTQADLEKWFGLPSVTELEEQGKLAGPADAEMAEVIERRERALAAIDRALLDEIRLRTEDIPNPIGQPVQIVDVVIDENIALFDHVMLEKIASIADPREVEIPDALIDALKECTPQALLRDLHRPEFFFDKTFEVIDAAAEQRMDAIAEARTAMTTSWKLPVVRKKPVEESREALAELNNHRRQPWISFLPQLTNRTVQE